MCKRYTVTAAMTAFLCMAGTALASPCASRDDIARALDHKFGESRQSLGLSGHSQVVELFVSAQGSWTLVATGTNGKSCILASGEAWQNSRKAAAGRESRCARAASRRFKQRTAAINA